MKNNILLSFFRWIQEFFKKLNGVFNYGERLIIISAMVVLIATGSLLIYDNYKKTTHEVAVAGGIYKEGIVAKNSDELVDTTNRLTKLGLTQFADDGTIIPAVAQTWEISSDVKTYTFTIKSNYNRDDVIKELERQKDKWPNISISSKDNDKIVFSFPDSYAPFLASTTSPVLPYGPYKLQKDQGTELIFVKNPDYIGSKPYLDKIVLEIYPDLENLTKAYKAKEIDGAYLVEDESLFKMANFYEFKLPRYNMMFFNTDREVLKDKTIRQKIKNYDKLDNPLTLNLVSVDNDKYHTIVKGLQDKFSGMNITLNVYYKSANDIITQIIPKRDYDILVYGLDYGADPDPYPFWHSTQSGEKGYNLSNFSNIDADVALEDARKTSDVKVRAEKYNAFWNIFNDEVPAVILSQDEWKFAVSNKFKGISTGWSVGPEDRFLKISDWYTKTKRVKN